MLLVNSVRLSPVAWRRCQAFTLSLIMSTSSFSLDRMLMHPMRASLAVCGVLLAMVGFVFLDSPIPMIPALPLVLSFLGSDMRSLKVTGGLLAFLCLISFGVNRPGYAHDLLRSVVVYGSLTLMVLPMVHLFVSQRLSCRDASNLES